MRIISVAIAIVVTVIIIVIPVIIVVIFVIDITGSIPTIPAPTIIWSIPVIIAIAYI